MSNRVETITVPFGKLSIGTLFTVKLKEGKAPTLFVKLPVHESDIPNMLCDACHQSSYAMGLSRYGAWRVHFCHSVDVQVTITATAKTMVDNLK